MVGQVFYYALVQPGVYGISIIIYGK